jgi:uncharacterized membrane protein
MLGLTNLGVVHTVVSLIAVAAALVSLLRYGGISLRTGAGTAYVYLTVLTCLTGFPIMQHGGFGKPHALGIITLVVLAVAAAAGRKALFGRLSPYVETVGYSATVVFHMIPAIAEGGTRLPPSDPFLDHPEAPAALALTGLFFLIFLIGAGYQVRRLRGRPVAGPAEPASQPL